MKIYMFLALVFSSFLAVACDDQSVLSVGGSEIDVQGYVQTNSNLSASFSGLPGIECDDVEDHGTITVTGTNLPDFLWIPGAGFGGYITGSGGSTGPSTMPNNPNNGEPDATCGDDIGVRQNHARGDMGPMYTSLRIGQPIEIEYSNGQSELFIVACRVCQNPGVPIPGTCGG